MIILLMYIAIFAGAYFIVSFLQRGKENKGFNSLKTVTFGDESAVKPNRVASVVSVVSSSASVDSSAASSESSSDPQAAATSPKASSNARSRRRCAPDVDRDGCRRCIFSPLLSGQPQGSRHGPRRPWTCARQSERIDIADRGYRHVSESETFRTNG